MTTKYYPCVELVSKEGKRYWKTTKHPLHDSDADEWIEKERLYFVNNNPSESFVSRKIKYIPLLQSYVAKYDTDYAFPNEVTY